jgi:hypothetical protein
LTNLLPADPHGRFDGNEGKPDLANIPRAIIIYDVRINDETQFKDGLTNRSISSRCCSVYSIIVPIPIHGMTILGVGWFGKASRSRPINGMTYGCFKWDQQRTSRANIY